MELVKNLHRDEIRSGYIVTSDVKKIWNRALEVWREIDRICRKHSIRYFACSGTLLGAARHGGVIPWDTDLDFCMLRPEFDRFRRVLSDELSDVFEIVSDEFHALNVCHSQTTLIENRNDKPHGLGIDVFVMDAAPDGTSEGFLAFNSLNELMGTVFNFPAVVRHVQSGGKTVNDWRVIEELNALPDLKSKFEFIHGYASALFDQSANVAWIADSVRNKINLKKHWFRDVVYLPFETVELPAPIDYAEVLTAYYGDWHKFVRDAHTIRNAVFSADIPWREFVARADWDIVFPPK